MVNETKPDTENASNWDHFGNGVYKESECDEGVLFWDTLQSLDLFFSESQKLLKSAEK